MCDALVFCRTNNDDCTDLVALSPLNIVAPLTSTEIKQRGFVTYPSNPRSIVTDV